MSKDDKYTDPELRSEIKERIHEGDKGGNPGQWSARKAQMMAAEYKKEMEKRGEEPYKTDKSSQDEGQKHLSQWSEEEWQTQDGSANAKQADGSMKRYLPKKAWDSMSEKEKKETEDLKAKGDKEGKQFVKNSDKASIARKDASKGGGRGGKGGVKGKDSVGKDEKDQGDDGEYLEDGLTASEAESDAGKPVNTGSQPVAKRTRNHDGSSSRNGKKRARYNEEEAFKEIDEAIAEDEDQDGEGYDDDENPPNKKSRVAEDDDEAEFMP